ncbi:MAG: flavodoxin family protein [Clostridia bacterium]|nr:flavodoxin family protein [Clostridia bacterium]
MKVLLINGSPHEKGCTYTVLCEVAGSLNKQGIETEIFWIGNKPISGCIGCYACRNLNKCVINDVVNECAQKLAEADGFVFGSPVHYASASGGMTSFMDRLFYSNSANNNAFKFKPGAVVAVARRAGNTATYEQLLKYMGISCMPIISSNYWNLAFGSTPEQIKQDLEGMQTMRQLGANMAFYLKCIKAGKESGVELPEIEQKIFTNFIR